jgi:TRAP-type mannitol/chloroaromatic compound transport system permease small subunit
LQTLIHLLDRFSDKCGRALSWLTILMMLVTCLVVTMRYVFAAGSIIFFQELVIYLHATVFMLGIAWTLKRQGHVRVDVFYRGYSRTRRAWVDSIGTLVLLIPVCVFLMLSSVEFVGQSWRVREVSGEANGVPAVYLLKTLIPLMALFLLIQGLAELLRNAIILTMDAPEDD